MIKIKISEVIDLERKRNALNSTKLEDIQFLDDNGNDVKISEEILNEWKYAGLNNIDLITTGFYLTYFKYK